MSQNQSDKDKDSSRNAKSLSEVEAEQDYAEEVEARHQEALTRSP